MQVDVQVDVQTAVPGAVPIAGQVDGQVDVQSGTLLPARDTALPHTGITTLVPGVLFIDEVSRPLVTLRTAPH